MDRMNTDERFWLVSGVTEECFAFEGSMAFSCGSAIDAEPDSIALTVTDSDGVYEMLIERRGDSCARVITRDNVEVDNTVGDGMYELVPRCLAEADWLRRGPFFTNRNLQRNVT